MKLITLTALAVAMCGCEIYWIPLAGVPGTTAPEIAAMPVTVPYRAARRCWRDRHDERRVSNPKSDATELRDEIASALREARFRRMDTELSRQQDEAFERWRNDGTLAAEAEWMQGFYRIVNERAALRTRYVAGDPMTHDEDDLLIMMDDATAERYLSATNDVEKARVIAEFFGVVEDRR